MPEQELSVIKIIHINYDEFKPGTYRGVEAFYALDNRTTSPTGDPGADFEEALKSCDGYLTMVSSSVDNFISDDPESSMRVAELRGC